MNVPLILMSVLALCLAAAVCAAELGKSAAPGSGEKPALTSNRANWERSVRVRTHSEREVQGRAERLESRMATHGAARRNSNISYRGLSWLRSRSRS